MSKYQSKYENLRSKMDNTMLALNAAKSAGGYNYNIHHSPLRNSQSPKGRAADNAQTDVMPQRRFNLNNASTPEKHKRNRSGSSALRTQKAAHQSYEPFAGRSTMPATSAPSATVTGLNELLAQVE